MLPNGSRRAKIRPPKRSLVKEINFDEQWAVLAAAITQIQQKNASVLSFEELYRRSYNLVLKKHGQRLYDNVKGAVSFHLQGVRVGLVAAMGADTNGAAFLARLDSEWSDHTLCMRMVSDVLLYLDRVFARDKKLPLVYDAGVALFSEVVMKANDHQIGAHLTTVLNTEIRRSREGEMINRLLLRRSVAMCETLDLEGGPDAGENYFERRVEPLLLLASGDYFTETVQGFGEGLLYIHRAAQFIREEEARVTLYLPPSTAPKVIGLMDAIVVSAKLETLAECVGEWMRGKMMDELGVLFGLSARVDGEHKALRKGLAGCIGSGELSAPPSPPVVPGGFTATPVAPGGSTTTPLAPGGSTPAPLADLVASKKGAKLVKPPPVALVYTTTILTLKATLDEALSAAFSHHPLIAQSMDAALGDVVNQEPKAAEYLSLYLDHHIKKSLKSASEVSMLDNAITIFRLIRDKDVFERYYKNHLAKRLLQNKAGARDLEAAVITRIRGEIGAEFTSKLEGMFRDMKISHDLAAEFSPIHQGLELEVNVLTTTFWPMQPVKDLAVTYPVALQAAKDRYEDFYLSKHSGRNLSWHPSFGSVDIRIRFETKVHEVNMSTYAAVIVLLFAEHQELTYEQLREMTGIPETDLKRQLQSIAVAPKTRILIKRPMSKEVNLHDTFSFNAQFKAPLTKVKVLTVSAGSSKAETDTEYTETIGAITKARRFETDAALVRIMKSRKKLGHNDLMAESIRQLSGRFRPPPQLIKQRIEALLEREYLKRDGDDRSVYHYLA